MTISEVGRHLLLLLAVNARRVHLASVESAKEPRRTAELNNGTT